MSEPTLVDAIAAVRKLHDRLKAQGREWWDERGDDRAYLMALGVEQSITTLEQLAQQSPAKADQPEGGQDV